MNTALLTEVQSVTTSVQLVPQASKGDSSPSPSPLDSTWFCQLPKHLLDQDFLKKTAETLSAHWAPSVFLAVVDDCGNVRDLARSHRAPPISADVSEKTLKCLAKECNQTNLAFLETSKQAPALTSQEESALAPSLLFKQFVSEHGFETCCCKSFRSQETEWSLMILAAWPESTSHHLHTDSFRLLEKIGNRVSHAVELWKLCQLGRRRSWFQSLRGKIGQPSWRIWVTAVLLMLLSMWMPFPYRPTRDCVVEPLARSYVAAPFEGQLETSWVRPGDQVEANQLLARFDGSQLRRDLAAAEAEYEGVVKRRGTAIAKRAGGELGVANMELAQSELKISSIRAKLDALDIKSSTPGFIVQGDWYGRDGAPFTTGQTLYEIAPLDQMTVQLQLNAEDLTFIPQHAQVKVFSDSTGNKYWSSKLERIHPRAEMVDEKAVFIGETTIENHRGDLRPGMKAYARIDAGYRRVGWLLFHKPYQWLQNQWIW